MEITQSISDITDVFIVNEQSHIIYYPEGVEAGEEVIYKIREKISEIGESMYNEIKKVNAPKINEEEGMKLVTFNATTKTWVVDETKSDYDYIAGEGTEDNTNSKWANAVVTKDGVDSYFVWIPRYAYRITYYTDETKTQVSSTNVGYGSIDVKFIKGIGTIAADGTVCKYADDETLTQSDYIIHPAFTSNADLGGGFGELSGLWVGKFESSRSDADATSIGESTTLKVAPSVTSWRNTTIGEFYTYAKEYNTNLKSHILKNSEWGAVAYLAYSQYGRNGNEIAVNQCTDKITGGGPGEGESNIYNSAYAYDATDFETTYSYISEQGKKASTTGNEYGIYDMSGGGWEYTASYYNGSTYSPSRYEIYASSFATKDGISNEYATVYTGTIEMKNYKKGDATYETSAWDKDGVYFVTLEYPFFIRGGCCEDTFGAGLFCFDDYHGGNNSFGAFRTCLCIM